jgi:hypothetical protein
MKEYKYIKELIMKADGVVGLGVNVNTYDSEITESSLTLEQLIKMSTVNGKLNVVIISENVSGAFIPTGRNITLEKMFCRIDGGGYAFKMVSQSPLPKLNTPANIAFTRGTDINNDIVLAELTWDAVPNATTYQITTQSAISGAPFILTTSFTSIDIGVNKDNEQLVQVRAIAPNYLTSDPANINILITDD